MTKPADFRLAGTVFQNRFSFASTALKFPAELAPTLLWKRELCSFILSHSASNCPVLPVSWPQDFPEQKDVACQSGRFRSRIQLDSQDFLFISSKKCSKKNHGRPCSPVKEKGTDHLPAFSQSRPQIVVLPAGYSPRILQSFFHAKNIRDSRTAFEHAHSRCKRDAAIIGSAAFWACIRIFPFSLCPPSM